MAEGQVAAATSRFTGGLGFVAPELAGLHIRSKLVPQIVDICSGPSRYEPRRGDDVERWIKARRDACSPVSDDYAALDWLLDDYREHAGTGTPLDAEVTQR